MLLVCLYHTKPSLFIQRNIQDLHNNVLFAPHAAPALNSLPLQPALPLFTLSLIPFQPFIFFQIKIQTSHHGLSTCSLSSSLLARFPHLACHIGLLALSQTVKDHCTVLIISSFFLLISCPFLFPFSHPLLMDTIMSQIMRLYINKIEKWKYLILKKYLSKQGI